MRPISQCRSISQPNNAAANFVQHKIGARSIVVYALTPCEVTIAGQYVRTSHKGKETEIRSRHELPKTYCKRNESQAASKLKCLLFKRIYTFIKLSKYTYFGGVLRFVLTYLPPECTASSTALTTCIVILNIHIFFWRVI